MKALIPTACLSTLTALASAFSSAVVFAQDVGYVGEARPGVPASIPPPRLFDSSTEHFEYLLEQHNGGVTHTYESVPKWEGIYSTAGNNFTTDDGTIFRTDEGAIVAGLLTPEYEAAFRYRLRQSDNPNSDHGVTVDRLTNCEPAGHPRWLLEPYTRELINTPYQSWFMNDLGNDTRRIHINQEHRNLDGTHYPAGDSVGFWTADDELIVHTVDVWPNDFFRGSPPTSNQFESVETFWHGELPNGEKRIFVNATFYDELAFAKPITLTYTFRRRPELVEFGYRQRYFDCSSNDNQYMTVDAQGNPTTQTRLPGEPGYNDPRGVDPNRNPDLPPDLRGQAKSPMFENSLQ